jgi:hypothetical protein
MVTAIALLVLLLIPQQGPDRVAVVTGPSPQTVQIMLRADAEAEYARLTKARRLSEREERMLAALVVALGTIPSTVTEPTLTPQERERFRWHRQPLQNPFPGRMAAEPVAASRTCRRSAWKPWTWFLCPRR